MVADRRRIVCVSNDPGGAAAVIPVARELAGRGHQVLAVTAGLSGSLFESRAPEVERRIEDDSIDRNAASALLQEHAADVLVSAAGTYNLIEHTFRLAAGDIGVPVVSVCDYWHEYSSSFSRTLNGTEVLSTPDVTCVPDESARLGLIGELRMDPDQVVVTGPPNLEASVSAFRSITVNDRSAWRERYGVREEEITVVFFSDAFYTGPDGVYETGEGRVFDDIGRSMFGYTPPEMLAAVTDSLRQTASTLERKVHLIVKPHPREHPEKLLAVLDEPGGPWLRSELTAEAPPRELISIVDVVVGMGSVVLLEAALAGLPTISVQIGFLEKDIFDPCVGNTLGYTIAVFDRPALDRTVRRILEGSVADAVPIPSNPLPIDGAAARAADVVEAAKRAAERAVRVATG